MKKVLFVLVSYFLVLQVLGQEKKMAIGVQVTPGISTYQSSLDYSPGSYYSNGVEFSYENSSHLRFNVGLSYEEKGAAIDHVFTDDSGNPYKSGSISFKHNYLSLPVTVTYKTGGDRYFYIGGGGFFNFLLESQMIYPELGVFNTTSSSNSEAGLVFIGGVFFPLNDHFAFDLALRDNLGLSDIGGGAGGSTTNVIGLQIAFKYRF